jgi:hypothetical protein
MHSDTYQLSYVNTSLETHYLETEFNTLTALIAFVSENYPDYCSYQIIVARRP